MKRTLLVDGNSLLKTGFLITKTIVFWDGKDNSSFRRKIYPQYKENRRKSYKTEEELQSFYRQKFRVQEYLEELYVRQGDFKKCEADDMIAHYCHTSKDEEIIILTLDRDLLQLINDKTSVLIQSMNTIFKKGDLVPLNGCSIISENVRLVKAVCGDSSDNISGIKLVGVKSLIERIKNKDKINKRERNILDGVTKNGILGSDAINKNLKIISMGKEFLTSEAKKGIIEINKESLDPKGREWKNALNLMMSDGILNILPKANDSWVDFIKPFLRLSRIEKDFYKNTKIKKNEI